MLAFIGFCFIISLIFGVSFGSVVWAIIYIYGALLLLAIPVAIIRAICERSGSSPASSEKQGWY